MSIINKKNHQTSSSFTVKGTTIVESIIAMTIISIAFSIGLMVVEMVLNSNKSALQYRVKNALYQEALTTKNTQKFLDGIVEQPDFLIERKISPYQTYQDLFTLELTARDNQNQIILIHQELIYVPQ